MSKLNRLQLNEITVSRVAAALNRRFAEIPNLLAWYGNSTLVIENKLKLGSLLGTHAGERCFIIGNGPSLATMNLTLLKDEIAIGLNRIYLLFDRMPFRPTYYVAVNELVLEQFANEIQLLSMPKFLNWNRRELFDNSDATTYFVKLGLGLSDRFEKDLTKPLSSGGTVTFVALQIAFFMGFKEAILIGVDHSFSSKGTPNTTAVRQMNNDKDHFLPNYFPAGVHWQLPDLRRSELAYAVAEKQYRAAGRRVLDATVGGKCPVFEKVEYEELF